MPLSAKTPLRLLVVEDDDGDAFLILRALRQSSAVDLVIRARDGVEAREMLEAGAAAPDLILIDLHMPRMNGLDLLDFLRDRGEGACPSVVLTSSTAVSDSMSSRLRGAARVVIKPDSIDDFSRVLDETIGAVCRAGRTSGAPVEALEGHVTPQVRAG